MIGQDSPPGLLFVCHACMYALGDIIQFMWLLWTGRSAEAELRMEG